MNPLVGIGGLGGTELLLIFLVIVLLFGAKKLPELARGSGQALRIFKAETKELKDGEEQDKFEPSAAEEAEMQRVQADEVEPQRRTEPGA
ncbi:Sec-independent protein translocase subunit TatA [Alteromonas gracilis]